MSNVRHVAMLVALLLLSACASSNFDYAYSELRIGKVGPIPLDD